MKDAKAGEGGALVGSPGLAPAGGGPGLAWRRLFLERPRPMDTLLKSVRWKAGRGENLGVPGVSGVCGTGVPCPAVITCHSQGFHKPANWNLGKGLTR